MNVREKILYMDDLEYAAEEIADVVGVTTAYVNWCIRRSGYMTPMPAKWAQEWSEVTAQLRPYFQHA